MSEVKEFVKREYNREDAWRARENSDNYWLETEKTKVAEMLPKKVNRSLDLGCGRGDFLKILSEVSEEIVALDFAEILLKDAKGKNKRNPNAINYILGDAVSLPFTSNSFDFVLAIQVIGHIPNQDLVLKELNRVLRDAGTLILSTGNSLSFNHFMNTILQMTMHIKRSGLASFASKFFKFFSHDREFWIKEQEHARDSYFYLKEELERNGFKVQSVKGAGFIKTGIQLIKNMNYRLSDSFPIKFCSSLIILKSYKNSEHISRRCL